MTELVLHPAQVETGLDQMGGITVAQRVDRDVLADARIRDSQPERTLHGPAIHEMTCGCCRGAGLAGEQPARVTMFRPPAAQRRKGDRRQHHEAVLVAFGESEMNVHAGAVDIGDFELHGLAESQTHAVCSEPEDPVTPLPGAVNDVRNLIDGEHIRQRLGLRWFHHGEPGHGLAEDFFMEEADAIAVQLDGAPALGVDQPLEEAVQFINGQIIRAAVDELGEAANGQAIGLNGLGGLAMAFQCA